MSGDAGKELTAKQERAIAALLTAPSIQKAAEQSEVPLRTLNRWLTEPAFMAAYMRARREAFSQAIALTQKYAPAAVTVLARVMTDAASSASAKVAAAAQVLKFGREGIDLDDVHARLTALEARAATKESRR